jgi:hypothetical protein
LEEEYIETSTLLKELEDDFINRLELSGHKKKIKLSPILFDNSEPVESRTDNYLLNKLIIKIPTHACSCYSRQLLNLFSEIPSEVLLSDIILVVPINQMKEYDKFLDENNISANRLLSIKPINDVLDAGLNFYCFTTNEESDVENLMVVRHNKRLLSKYIRCIINRYY